MAKTSGKNTGTRRAAEPDTLAGVVRQPDPELAGSRGPGRGAAGTDVRILAIDPGLASTGWAVIHVDSSAQSVRHVASGVIKTVNTEKTVTRVLAIARELKALIQTHRPDEFAAEAYRNYGRVLWNGVQTLYTLGAFAALAAADGRGVSEYSAVETKRSIGVTDGTKASVKARVTELLDLPPGRLTEHAADAMAVALCHLAALRRSLTVVAKGVDVFGNAPGKRVA